MNRVANLSLTIFFLVVTVFLKDITVSALSVTTPSKIFAINGGNATFRIRYTLMNGESLRRVRFRKGFNYLFEAPYYVPPGPPMIDGMFFDGYVSRASTDYSFGKTNFTITLSQVTPDDEGQYTVEVSIYRFVTKSSVSHLVVDFLPGTPSISGAPSQPVLGGAGPTVLTCTANLGKPQAAMVWSRRDDNAAYTSITENVIISIVNNSDGTTNGTSTLTVNLDTANDGVQFRCHVFNRQAALSVQTGTIKVIAPVPVSHDNIQVCKTSTTQCTSPFDYYVNDQVSLTCGVNPSSPPIPAPHQYSWLQIGLSGSVSGAVLSITATESVFVCYASNTVRGVTYTASKLIITRTAAKPTIQGPVVDTQSPTHESSVGTTRETGVPSPHEGLTCDAKVAISISVCAVLILLLATILILMRRQFLLLSASGRSRFCRSCATRPARPSLHQTSEVASSAYVATSTNNTVETEFTSASCGRPDKDVAALLESLRLRVRRPVLPAVGGEQLATNSMEELSINDLTSRLIGVPLGRNGIMLEKLKTVDPPERAVGTQSQENEAYSELQSPVYLKLDGAAYVNVTQASIYEGLANREGDSQGEYEKLDGISVEDNASEYEIMTSPAQRR